MEEKRMHLKVQAAPSPDGRIWRQDVRITDAETGQILSGVQSIDIKFHLDKPHEMTLTVIGFDFDIEAEGRVVPAQQKKLSWWRRILARWSY